MIEKSNILFIYPRADGAVKKISYLFFWPPGFDVLDAEDEGHGAYAIWERMDDGCFIFNLPALQWLRID